MKKVRGRNLVKKCIMKQRHGSGVFGAWEGKDIPYCMFKSVEIANRGNRAGLHFLDVQSRMCLNLAEGFFFGIC